MSRCAALFLAFSLVGPNLSPAADKDKNHHDAFMPGDADENRIAREVRHQLVTLPYYGIFDDLAFRVVKRIEGVTDVENQIKVLPLSPMDDQIRLAEYRAIYGDPTLSTRYGYRALPSIHIIVENGHVTLEGVVANEADKNLVNIRANGVPNVFSVTNNLVVESQMPK
jgi:hyperosmotically inducible protein